MSEQAESRISLPEPETMTPEQRAVFDAVVKGPRGKLIGPLRAALLNADLADRWQKLGEVLRYNTKLPRNISELAIIITARHWNSELEWQIHSEAALVGGVSPEIVEAVKAGRYPKFGNPDESAVYEFTRQIITTGFATDAAYAETLNYWGDVGVVELTALIGYYSMVAMTLNAHQIPLPDGRKPVLGLNGTSPELSKIPHAPNI